MITIGITVLLTLTLGYYCATMIPVMQVAYPVEKPRQADRQTWTGP
jgi:hypothetical protein